MTKPETIDAGDFKNWLEETQAALIARVPAKVPCGQCSACCKSHQFIFVDIEEHEAIAAIGESLLFPAPGKSGFVMGFDANGHCPMFKDEHCTIYADRPHTCRTYDCRIFTASGVEPKTQTQIATQSKHWVFSYPQPRDRTLHQAVQGAAAFLKAHDREIMAALPNLDLSQPIQLALSAVKLSTHFESGEVGPPPLEDIIAALEG